MAGTSRPQTTFLGGWDWLARRGAEEQWWSWGTLSTVRSAPQPFDLQDLSAEPWQASVLADGSYQLSEPFGSPNPAESQQSPSFLSLSDAFIGLDVVLNRQDLDDSASAPVVAANAAITSSARASTADGRGITVLILEANYKKEDGKSLPGYANFFDPAFKFLPPSQRSWVDNKGNNISFSSGAIVNQSSPHATAVADVVHQTAPKSLLISGLSENDLSLISNLGSSFSRQRLPLIVNQSYTSFATNSEPAGQIQGRAVALDARLYEIPSILVVKAAGNYRGKRTDGKNNEQGNPLPFPYPLYEANIVNDSSSGKNTLVVGAVDQSNRVASFSNFGPTFDGRLAPLLMAPGVGLSLAGYDNPVQGTSFAAPAVSGAAALIAESLRTSKGQRFVPSSALLKAILAHGAKDIKSKDSLIVNPEQLPVAIKPEEIAAVHPGPDYPTGYGLLDIEQSLNLVNRLNKDVVILQSEMKGNINKLAGDFAYELARFRPLAGSSEVKATLVWLDPPSQPELFDRNYLAFRPDFLARSLKPVAGISEVGSWKLDPIYIGRPAAQSTRKRLIEQADPRLLYNDNIQQIVVDASQIQGDWTFLLQSFPDLYSQESLRAAAANKKTITIPYALVLEGVDAGAAGALKTRKALSRLRSAIGALNSKSKNINKSISSQGDSFVAQLFEGSSPGVTAGAETNISALAASSSPSSGLGLIEDLGAVIDDILANTPDIELASLGLIASELVKRGIFDEDDSLYFDEVDNVYVKFDRSFSNSLEFNSTLGLDALGFSLSGGWKGEGALALNFGIDTSSDGSPQLLQAQSGEPLVGLQARFDVTDLNGKLGFLDLQASPSSGKTAALTANVGLSLNLDADGSIASELSANLDLNATAKLSSNLSDQLPSFSTDIAYGLKYDPKSQKFVQKDFELKNAQVDVSGLVRSAKPMIDKVKGVVNEFKPVIDFLTQPIPGLDRAGLKLSILDLAKNPLFSAISGLPPINTAFLEAIPQITAISRSLDQLSQGELPLGSLSLNQDQLAGINPRSARFDSLLADVYKKVNPDAVLADIQKKIQDGLKSLPAGSSSSFKASAGLSGNAYFEFSLLNNPSSALGLLLGDPTVDLFRFGLPGLDLNVGGEIKTLLWPVPPITGAFGGRIGASIAPLHFGYDATGLLKLTNGGTSSDLFEGFYLDTLRDKKPGLSLFAELYLNGSVGIPRVLSAGAEANVRGTLSLNLNDPNADGRIRALEIASNFKAGGIGNVFDINGAVTLGFSVFAEYISFSFTKGITTDRKDLLKLGPIKLLDLSRPGGRAPLPLGLGRMEGASLRLNVGAFAIDRLRNNEDIAEHFSLNGGLQVVAEAIGSQGFDGVQRVMADFGEGRDVFDGGNVTVDLDIKGGVDDDVLRGGAGNDVLAGGAGNDLIDGGAGNDTLRGDAGTDTLRGGDGDDRLEAGEGDYRLDGGAGKDLLVGSAGDDQLDGGADSDTLEGAAGADTLEGGTGADLLRGGLGEDHLVGGIGRDTLDGGEGSDTLEGGSDADSLLGGAGQDLLIGDVSNDANQLGNDTLRGDAGADVLQGMAGDDHLDGGEGDDLVEGGAGNDVITDSSGSDTLMGGEGQDTITGGVGFDVIAGEAGDDVLVAGADGAEIQGNDGNDRITGSRVRDLVMAGAGDDTVRGRGGDDLIVGSAGNDLLLGDDTANTTADGNDELFGEEGSDTLMGGGGDDLLVGDVGEDRLEGDSGNDTLDGGDHHDVLLGGSGDDSLSGGAGDDSLLGEAGNDTISGGIGRDQLFGGDGADSLFGGLDADVLQGNAGNDTLVGDSNDSLGGAADTLAGGEGNDFLLGFWGNDVLQGGSGIDTLIGGEGNDLLRGGSSSDLPEALSGDGDDLLQGEAGNDEIWGGDGNDQLEGGSGDDLLLGDDTDDPTVAAGKGSNDTLIGGDGNDTLFGGLGDDLLIAGEATEKDAGGFDRLVGGYGDDTLVGYRYATGEFNADSSKGVVYVLAPGSGKDTILNFQSNLDANGKQIASGGSKAVSDVIQLTNGLSFGFLGIEEELRNSGAFAGQWITSLIDLDTDQVLAELVGIRKAQIGRNNIDEQNVPPDRLRLETGNPVLAKQDEFRLAEGKVRDPNGAGDLDALQFFLRKVDQIDPTKSAWQDWHDLGLMGVVNGQADLGRIKINGKDEIFLIVSGASVAEQARGATERLQQNDQKFDRRSVTRLYRWETHVSANQQPAPGGQWMEVFFEAPNQGLLPFRSTTLPVPEIDPQSGLPKNGLKDLDDVDARFIDVNRDGFIDLVRIGRQDKTVILEVLKGTSKGFSTPIEHAIAVSSDGPIDWLPLVGDREKSPLELWINGEIYTLDPNTFKPTLRSGQPSVQPLPLPRGSNSADLLGSVTAKGISRFFGVDNLRRGLVWLSASGQPLVLPAGLQPIAITAETDSAFWGLGVDAQGIAKIFRLNNADKSAGTLDDFHVVTPTLIWPDGATPTAFQFTEMELVGNTRRIVGFASIANETRGFQIDVPTSTSFTTSLVLPRVAWLADSSNVPLRLQPSALNSKGQLASRAVSEIQVNQKSVGNPGIVVIDQAVAALADGRIVAVWRTPSDSLGVAIRAQLFSPTGTKLGNEFDIETSLRSPFELAVAGLNQSEFVVSWTELPAPLGGVGGKNVKAKVYRVLDNATPRLIAEISPALPAPDTIAYKSSLTELPSGGFVMAWTQNRPSGIRAKIFDSFGQQQGDELTLNATPEGPHPAPALATLADGTVVVAWQDWGEATLSRANSIRIRSLDPETRTLRAERVIGTQTPLKLLEIGPSVTALSEGGFVVAWSDDRLHLRIFSGADDENGTYVSFVQSIDAVTQPVVAALSSGGFVVSWLDSSGLPDGQSVVRGQIFDVNGNKQGIEFLVHPPGDAQRTQPDIVALPQGGFMVVWADSGIRGVDEGNAALVSTTEFKPNQGGFLRGQIFNDQGIPIPAVGGTFLGTNGQLSDLPDLRESSSSPLSVSEASTPIDISSNGQVVLGVALDRFGRQRAVRWEKANPTDSNFTFVRDLGSLPVAGQVAPTVVPRALVGEQMVGQVLMPQSPNEVGRAVFAAESAAAFGLITTGDSSGFSSPRFADIDADGDLDLFLGNYDYINFLRNDGTATSPIFVVSKIPGIGYLGSELTYDIADIDADGDLDIIYSTYFAGGISLLRNNGKSASSSFGSPESISLDLGGLEPQSIAVVDIDDDGLLDVLIGTYDNDVRLYRNVGTASRPSFGKSQTIFSLASLPADMAIEVQGVDFADIDGDGDLDAFFGADNGSLISFKNVGSASNPVFSNNYDVVIAADQLGYYPNPELVDIDGDGDLDAFVGVDDGLRFFRNTGSLSRAVISWDGGLLDLNDIATPPQGVIFTEALGLAEAVGQTPGTRKLLVNGSDGNPYILTFEGLLRTDAQAWSQFANGPASAVSTTYLARSGIGLAGKPAMQVFSLPVEGSSASAPPKLMFGAPVSDLDGMVDGSLSWFDLDAKGSLDDLFAMGRVQVAFSDTTADGVIDDRDAVISSEANPEIALKIYKNNGASFVENKIYASHFDGHAGTGAHLISGSFSFESSDSPVDQGAAVSYAINIGSAFAPVQTGRPINGAVVSIDSDAITLAAHGLTNGSRISFELPSSGSRLPDGISANHLYWVKAGSSPNVFKLSESEGGPAIDITSVGNGDLAWRLHAPLRILDPLTENRAFAAADGKLLDLFRFGASSVNSDGSITLRGFISEPAFLSRLLADKAPLTISLQSSSSGSPISESFALTPQRLLDGLSQGAVAIGDLDGDGDSDFVLSGYGNLSRRTATGAIVPIPEFRVYQTVAANHIVDGVGHTILRQVPVSIPGLAKGSIKLEDVNSDGRLDLVVTGEDLFVDDNPERFQVDEQVGGNPNTSVYLNRSKQQIVAPDYVDALFDRLILPGHGLSPGDQIQLSVSANGVMPDGLKAGQQYYVKPIDGSNIQLFFDKQLTQLVKLESKGAGTVTVESTRLVFQNQTFPANSNDGRWASFDYRFRTDDLEPGVYALRAVPLDHARSDVLLEPISGVPVPDQKLNGQILKGSATENLFVLADTSQDFYEVGAEQSSSAAVVIEGFNPYMDRIQLRMGVDSTGVGRFTFDVRREVGDNALVIVRKEESTKKEDKIVLLRGLIDPALIKISTPFAQGNVVFADYIQSENPFILSPLGGRLRDASALTGFIVTDKGSDQDDILRGDRGDGYLVDLDTSQVSHNFFVRLLQRVGLKFNKQISALAGGAGNDTLVGGGSNIDAPPVTYLDGGSGDDQLRGSNLQSQIDLLLGGEGNDLLDGLAGYNVLFGQAGNDTLQGGLNSDTLFGGAGEDVLSGGGSSDTADYSQAVITGIDIDLSETNHYQRLDSRAPQNLASNDGDGGQDWINLVPNYLLNTIVSAEVGEEKSGNGSILRIPGHGLLDGARIKLRARELSDLPVGKVIGTSQQAKNLTGYYYVKTKLIGENATDYIELYQDSALTKRIAIVSAGQGRFDLLGDVSSIENVIGTIFDDRITGDRQRNTLRGGAGDDTIRGGLDRDLLDGGSGNDQLIGGEGSDTLIGGGGQDRLVGGTGDDVYIIGSELFTLEQAFEALGGRLSDLSPIPVVASDPARQKPITYEQFVLLADESRWIAVDGKPQFDRFRALGLLPDPMLFERAKRDPRQGWLRVAPGGTRIEAGVVALAGNDIAYLDLDQLISLRGLQPGQIGLSQSGTNLVIDINRDGIAEDSIQRATSQSSLGSDVTIRDFFRSNGTEAGENDVSLRIRGLQATYYDENPDLEANSSDLTGPKLNKIKLQRIDRQVDFNWLPSSNGDSLLRPVDGRFAVVWDGLIQPSSDGQYQFNVDREDASQSDYQLFIGERLVQAQDIVRLSASEPQRIRLTYYQKAPDVAIGLRLQWKDPNGESSWQTISGDQFSTSQTIVANDVLARSRQFVPELSDAAVNISSQVDGYRPASDWKSQVKLADFNGDGLPDLLLHGRDSMGQSIAAIYANRPQILRLVDIVSGTVDFDANTLRLPAHNLKSGDEIRFEDPVDIGDALPVGLAPNKPYIVDVLDDNRVRLRELSGLADGSFVDLVGNGSGRLRYLSPTDRFSLASDSSTRLFSLDGFDELVSVNDVDIDSDGDLDLVAIVRNAFSDGQSASRINQLLAYLNNGEGQFTSALLPQDLSAAPITGDLRPLFADVDQDGRVDLAISWNSDLSGDGLADTTELRLWRTGGRTLFQSTAVIQEQIQPQLFVDGRLSAADLNQDGSNEIILSGAAVSNSVYVVRDRLEESSGIGRTITWAPPNTFAYGQEYILDDLLDKAKIDRLDGKSYRISLSSSGFDAYLELLDKNRKVVDFDDDSGIGFDSELTVVDQFKDGSPLGQFLRVTSYSPNSTGDYELKIEEVGRRVIVYRWQDGLLEPVIVKDFLDDVSQPSGFAAPVDIDLDGSTEMLFGGLKQSQLAQVDTSTLAFYEYSDLSFGELPGGSDASVQWIDQDNDGDLDLFLTAVTEQGPVTQVIINPVVGSSNLTTFQELGTLLPGLVNASAAWADVDGDTDLDLVLSGAQGLSGAPYLQLFRNTTVDRDGNGNRIGTQNFAPDLNLEQLEVKLINGDQAKGETRRLILQWAELFSGEEPFTTNLRLGTSPGGSQIISPLSNSDGRRLVSEPGNNGRSSRREMPIWALMPGQKHYWAVQAIDNGFLGSEFSAEQTFVMNPFATEEKANVIPPDLGINLRQLYGDQISPAVTDTTYAFTLTASGLTIGGQPIISLSGPSEASEDSTISITLNASALANESLELRLSGDGISLADFVSLDQPILVENPDSATVKFTYHLSRDWKTEGEETIVFELYGSQALQKTLSLTSLDPISVLAPASNQPSNPSSVPPSLEEPVDGLVPLGRSLKIKIKDTSVDPQIETSLLDFNRDGSLDLVRQVLFPDRAVLALPDGASLDMPVDAKYAFFNINSDQYLDLLLWAPKQASRIFLGGDSGFIEVENSAVGLSGKTIQSPASIRILNLDANGDGYQDLWIADSAGVRLFLGSDNKMITLHEYDFDSSKAGNQPLLLDSGVKQLLALNLDGDGDMDLLVSNGSSLRRFANTNGLYKEIATGTPIRIHHELVISGDYDNDGRLDLLFLTKAAGARIFKNTGNGFAEQDVNGAAAGRALTISQLGNRTYTAATWFDADHDGRFDLALGLNDGTIHLFHQQDGVGQFQQYLNQPTQRLDGLNKLEAHDMDGDGDLDLIASNAKGELLQLANVASVANSAPFWDPNATFVTQISGGSVRFFWSPANDDHTGQDGFSYSLRVGRTPGAGDVFSTPTAVTGAALLSPSQGNVGSGGQFKIDGKTFRGWTLDNLQGGTYYWSVQAIDSSGRTSAAGPEQQLQVLPSLKLELDGKQNIEILEGDDGLTQIKVRVSVQGAHIDSQPISVDYQVLSDPEKGDTANTAEDSPDLLAVSGRLEIPNGESSATFSFNIVGDTIKEGSEQFRIRLSNVFGALLPVESELKLSIKDESSDGSATPFLDLQPVSVPALTDRKLVNRLGGRQELVWDVKNLGTSPGGDPFGTEVWLSTDAIADTSDRFLGRIEGLVPPPGSSRRMQAVLDLPSDLPPGENYKLLIIANPEAFLLGDAAPLSEQNAALQNNVLIVDISLDQPPLPDLGFIVNKSMVPTSAKAGSEIFLNTVVVNNGASVAGGWRVSAYLSTDSTLDAGDLLLDASSSESDSSRFTPALESGQKSSDLQFGFVIPSWLPDGKYNIIFATDQSHSRDGDQLRPSGTNLLLSRELIVSGGMPLVSLTGLADQSSPQIISGNGSRISVAEDLRLQANEMLQLGLGNRTRPFNSVSVTNNVGKDVRPPVFIAPSVDGNVLSVVVSELLQDLPNDKSIDPKGFIVTAGSASIAVTSVVQQGSLLLLKLASSVEKGASVAFRYSPSGDARNDLRDLSGNPIQATSTPLPVLNLTEAIDNQAPLISSPEVRNVALTDGTRGQISFVLSEPLQPGPGIGLDPAEFQISGGKTPISVRDVVIDGVRGVLTLDRRVELGETLKLAYQPGRDGGDDIQDAAPLWAKLFRIESAAQRKLVQEISSIDFRRLRFDADELILALTDGDVFGRLKPDQDYELELPRGFVNDLAGNPLEPTNVRFRTLAEGVDRSFSSVLAQSPLQGADLVLEDLGDVKKIAGPLIFRLQRQGSLDQSTTVSFSFTGTAPASSFTVSGDAAAKVRFNTTTKLGSAVFAPGSRELLIRVTPKPDSNPEPDQSIKLSLLAGAGYTVSSADFEQSVTIVDNDIPVNDSFANARLLAGSQVTAPPVSNRAATAEDGEPVLGDDPNRNTLWWKWVAPANGRFVFSTQGSAIDTRLALLKLPTGSLGRLSDMELIEINANGASDGGGLIRFDATSGVTYYVMVDGEGGEAGNVNLQLATNTVQMTGAKVVEGLDRQARVSVQLARGVAGTTDPVTLAFRVNPVTAATGKGKDDDFKVPVASEITFPVFNLKASAFQATSNEILLPKSGLTTGDQVALRRVGSSSRLPNELEEMTYYVEVVGDRIQLFSSFPQKGSKEGLVTFSAGARGSFQLSVVERGILFDILNDDISELDERFQIELSLLSGSALIEDQSATVVISDLLDLDATAVLPGGVENGRLLERESRVASSPANLKGNSGNNQLYGNSEANLLEGLDGDDLLVGGVNDTLVGGAGNDSYVLPVDLGSSKFVRIRELAGSAGGKDTLLSAVSVSLLDFPNVENIQLLGGQGLEAKGSSAANQLVGSLGDDTLLGGGGHDTLNGAAGRDRLVGGTGNDVYILEDDFGLDSIVESAGGGIDLVVSRFSVDLSRFPNVENATLLDVELPRESLGDPLRVLPLDIDIVGTSGVNVLTGNSGGNSIDGGRGNDRLFGGAGDDTLIGGLGRDTLDGGSGRDVFLLDSPLVSSNVDRIVNFSPVEGDVIQLDRRIFVGISPGALQASTFVTGPRATQASHRIIFDQSRGSLFYDPDGSGKSASVLFATLFGSPGLQLTAEQFLVI